MIDVEKCSLRAFEQDPLPLDQSAMKINNRVRDEGAQLFAGGEILLVNRIVIDRFRAERPQDAVVFLNLGLQLRGKKPRLHQIGNAQPSASGLVAVGGSNNALGGPNFNGAFSLAKFALHIEGEMIGQYQMSAVTEEQVPADLEPELAQAFDLAEQRNRV